MGVPYRWVVTQASTRVCTTILDRGSGAITELVENGRPLSAGELEEFLRAYAEEAARADVAVIIGSLPADTPPSFYCRLVERTPCPAILDFRGEGLLACLALKPYVVKPNREELAQTLGKPLEGDAELVEAMHSLNHRGAAWVVVTQGPRPIWVTSSEGAWRVHPLPPNGLVNPIGCGDVMAAAMAWSIRTGRTVLEAVGLGVAAAAANLRHPLPGRFEPARIHQRARQVRIEPI
jgi:fructose-1-phosphate kinase PfkB-like protein